MFARGLLDPMLIPSYFATLASLAAIAVSVKKLTRVDRDTNRAYNQILHQLKWAGITTCLSVSLVKSSVRIWYISTAQGPSFVDVSWWKHLWVIFVVAAAGTAGLAGYLLWADRPYPSGHCRRCGYAIKGNLSGVCPECGVTISP